MEIKEIEIAELIPYDKNARRNNKAVNAVLKSIKKFGFKVPIVIDSDKVIVSGHTRYKAAQKLGLEKVPCITADDLSPEQIKAFRLADNKTAALAEWDLEKLEIEAEELPADLLSEFHFELSKQPEPQKPKSSKAKGDFETVSFMFSAEQLKIVEAALTEVGDNAKENFGNPNSKGNALYEIVRQWLENGNRNQKLE